MKKIIMMVMSIFFIMTISSLASTEFTSKTEVGWLTAEKIMVFEKKATIWIIDNMNTVRKINHLVFDETKPLPEVLTEMRITILDFIDIMNEMHPEHNFNHIKFLTPMFVYRKNQIVVSVYSQLHSLVHELVHYVQKEYKNYEFEDFGKCFDYLEYEAITIQKKWEQLYIEGLDDTWFKE